MDHPNDHLAATESPGDPPQQSEAAIRAVLEQSQRDVAEGRTVPLRAVLDRIRATAKAIRRDRAGTTGAGQRRA